MVYRDDVNRVERYYGISLWVGDIFSFLIFLIKFILFIIVIMFFVVSYGFDVGSFGCVI